ncbi:Hsp20/alpha crystallin family protein [Bifidobacterium pullorum subsp. saeculare]|uniref:Hsp20/alpha crystallin family protein n=1 Tax=Bifidobacterium pullorum subsp. saeculare TaxID=78257 RepID=A0A938WZA3_9BIFI|nr:Hsp20/alpha crystallin family protein [Bifidobacterium pullorum]MBM6700335.1 Hsp20/alpha crystallin family protein [Bifidobacterium pullorum subsp. saeculare]
MAMFPALLNDGLFNDLFNDPFFAGVDTGTRAGANHAMSTALMSADVRETDKAYDVDIDMPGFKKDDINLELQNGYLTVSAHRDGSHDEKDKEGKWLRRERYAGSVSRSFYVGDDVKEGDIKASYKDGTLCVQIPKPETKPQVEAKHTIAIEG